MGYKGKGKGRPRTGHEGPEGKQMYSYTLPSTSALDAGGWSAPRPGHFTPGKDPVPIVQEAGWAPGAGLDECGKSRPHRYSISGPVSARLTFLHHNRPHKNRLGLLAGDLILLEKQTKRPAFVSAGVFWIKYARNRNTACVITLYQLLNSFSRYFGLINNNAATILNTKQY